MSENPDTTARRISFHPPRHYSGEFKTAKMPRPAGEIVDFYSCADLGKILQDVHPWPILPRIVREMIKGPILLFAQTNRKPFKSELSAFIWNEAAPLLEQLGMLVQVVEKSEAPGRFRILSISLVAAETRDKITDIIEPEQNDAGDQLFSESDTTEEIPTSPGTPTAKANSSKPPSRDMK